MAELNDTGQIQPGDESDGRSGGADVEDPTRTLLQCEKERRRLEQRLASLVAQSRQQQASALADLRSAADQVAEVTSRGEATMARVKEELAGAEKRASAAQDAAMEARAEATKAHARAESAEDRARSAEVRLAAVLNSRSYRAARLISNAAHPRQTLAARRFGRA
jgi:chromosome segregation ATPase